MKIRTLLTDNGSQITDRFTSKEKTPSTEHAFDRMCVGLRIGHRLILPRHPQTNGMADHFNGRISVVRHTHHFDSSASLDARLGRYACFYYHHLPQRALRHVSSIDSL